MKCSRAKKLINDHVDNLLSAGHVRNLESHLQKCVNCRDFLTDMESIRNNAKELSALNPSEYLWPEIKEQILTRNQKAPMHGKGFFENFTVQARGMTFAISTLLAIFVLIPLIYYGLPHIRNSNTAPESIALNHFQIAEQHYQSAIEVLDRAIKTRGVELNQELATVFKKNLEIIDDSIRVCKEAINQSPENPEANRLLLICYKRKIELLNEIKGLTMPIG